MKKIALLFVLVLICSAVVAQAASKEWLHVKVDDHSSDDPAKVRVNIPISLVETMLPMIQEKAIREGKIHFDEKDLSLKELRQMWKAIKDEGDTEFVTVEKRGEHVRVFTKDNFLMVQTDEHSNKKVSMKLPLAIVDAALSGNGDELDLMAAVQALKKSGVRDFITVEDEDTMVRVWIDDNKAAE